MIIVSDFNGTLEIDGKIDRDLFRYLLTMALSGHRVGIFTGNPDQAKEYIYDFAGDSRNIAEILKEITIQNASIINDVRYVQTELLVGDLIHIGDKLQIRQWLGRTKADIGFDDDMSGSPINALSCHVVIDRNSDDYDAFIKRAQTQGPQTVSEILTSFHVQDAPAPSFMN
ncbi:MAG: hypothetical protein LRZ85_04470 [Alphaproteobacteria bacterium]|nr:hypothetical protein [Alphaproteobacteria bacterium]MCD8571476.1 hypothetical protein [Alphaproteobacteria bacterium]